jgi:hypothetical protein
VTRNWPEHRVRGKKNTTVGDVLSHAAGVPYLRPDLTPAEQIDCPR